MATSAAAATKIAPTNTLGATYRTTLGAVSQVASTAGSIFSSIDQTVGMGSAFITKASAEQKKSHLADKRIFNQELAAKTAARQEAVLNSLKELTKGDEETANRITENYNSMLELFDEMDD